MTDTPDGFPRFREPAAPRKTGRRGGAPTMGYLRRLRFTMDGGRCQAHGMHADRCPDRLDGHAWVVHHVHPRSHGGADTIENLITVWNGETRFGAGGCHQRIHTDQTEAQLLGLLDLKGPTP